MGLFFEVCVRELHLRNCVSVKEDKNLLDKSDLAKFLSMLDNAWEIVESKYLTRTIELDKFKTPLKLVQLIGNMAEEQWHHPELILGWGFVCVKIYTHELGGLLESDFIFAAKVDHIIATKL